MASDNRTSDTRMDPGGLYREEIFTDRRVGTIRRLTPVRADGSPDETRTVAYSGQAQLLTPMGALPLSFEIPASSLEEAVQGFSGATEEAVERAMEELKELRRETNSSIVLPESGSGGLGGVGGPGGLGGLPGDGKIQIP
ncbi:hypothetical protein BMS3Bbin12_00973 [bacterium BMS3Bbin12]|nr:hypothetical protein BMS3Abin12_01479 [bacterium BMS3Abin12]GBE47806.1 hypothetical protein BMS3Bbin12_00973 [bacterium BMS3Bbin12]GBE51053.1 hypothetical protein BMS3Bbin13_02006 [bacterium BMS3Bbin13]HDJ86727.1 hypothetical protein [Chromatiales bacterium]HDK02403.1 hypothetical protein [Gammaproteobacteria bacterium]